MEGCNVLFYPSKETAFLVYLPNKKSSQQGLPALTKNGKKKKSSSVVPPLTERPVVPHPAARSKLLWRHLHLGVHTRGTACGAVAALPVGSAPIV
jgi:hypothetical protein